MVKVALSSHPFRVTLKNKQSESLRILGKNNVSSEHVNAESRQGHFKMLERLHGTLVCHCFSPSLALQLRHQCVDTAPGSRKQSRLVSIKPGK